MYYYKMSVLEEVDVEEQLQNQYDSDTPVIKINTEVKAETNKNNIMPEKKETYSNTY